MNVIAQNYSCTETDSSQRKLNLNGNNFRLLDNALRCFELNSVADEKDSLVRIWILDDNFPDTPTTWRIKMFEYGKKAKEPLCNLYLLEWGFNSSDSSFPVKCVKKIRMTPNQGWQSFNKDTKRLHLQELYSKPLINNGFVMVDQGMLIFQFLSGHTTHTVDFTGLIDVFSPINTLQFNYSKKITYLFWYIQQHFSIVLSLDLKGQDFLEEPNKVLGLRK